MDTSKDYFPQVMFGSEIEPVPRVFIAPQRYIQGQGVLDHIGRYLSLVNARRAGILISRR